MASLERLCACAVLLAFLLLQPVTSATDVTSTVTPTISTNYEGLSTETTDSAFSTTQPITNRQSDDIRNEDFLLANVTNPTSPHTDVTQEGSDGWSTETVTSVGPVAQPQLHSVTSSDPRQLSVTLSPLSLATTNSLPRKKSKNGNRQKQGGKKNPQTLDIALNNSSASPALRFNKSGTKEQSESPVTNIRERIFPKTGSPLEYTVALSVPVKKPPATTTALSTAALNDPPWFHGDSPFYSHGSGSGSEGPSSKRDSNPPVVGIPEDPFAEPAPDWIKAKAQWGLAWEVHIFFAGPLFAVLGAYSLISLLRIRSFIRLLGRGYFISLNCLLLVLGVARSVYLLLDGYNSRGRFPAPVAYFFLNIGYPCLSSAFAVLFLALLRATRVQLLSARIQRPGVLSAALVFHFSFSISADVIVGSMEDTAVLLFACQLLFAAWCLSLSFAYFYVFRRLHKAALRKQGEMIRVTFTKLHIDGARLPRKLPRPTLALAVRVTLVTAVLSVAAAVMQVYGMVFVYGVFPTHQPEPWPWWAYQFSSRVVELAMCLALSYVATQPLRDYEEKPNVLCSKVLSCRRLTPSCCCKEEPDSYDAYLDSHGSGFRNSGFNHSLDGHTARRGNSLPSFRPVPLVDPDIGSDGLPLNQHGGARGGLLRHEMIGGGSLQTGHQRSTTGRALTDGLSMPGCLNATTSSDGRPTSMLFKDKGFIRFRSDGDPEQPMELSDGITEEDLQGSPSTWGSVKAEAGSSGRQSLCEDDFVQSSLSPFFQHAYRQQQLLPKFKRFSRCSLETLDNNSGGDLSSEQLSNVVPFRGQPGLSNSALDFHLMHRKYGSTCSSESAANSFDVTFFLQQGVLVSPSAPSVRNDLTPHPLPPPPPVAIRSISPLATRAAISSSRRFQGVPLNLDLSRDGLLSCGLVNVACGTEDVTPDSAVYLDLHLSRDSETETSPESIENVPPPATTPAPALSHSLSDLSGWRLGTSRCKRSLSFLNRLKGSSFSLNASLHGYELLGAGTEEVAKPIKDVAPEAHSSPRTFTSLSDVRREMGIDLLPQVDSGLLGDCRELVVQVDRASQTEVTTPDVKKKLSELKSEFLNGLIPMRVPGMVQT